MSTKLKLQKVHMQCITHGSRNEAQITTNSEKRDWINAPSRVFWNDSQIRIVWKTRSIKRKCSFPVSDCSGRWHLQQIFRAGSESPDGNVRMYHVRLISRSHVTQYFVSEEEYFEIYPVLNRQPMKFKQNRGNMVAFPGKCNKTSRRVLDAL